jgi:hypothetical protein
LLRLLRYVTAIFTTFALLLLLRNKERNREKRAEKIILIPIIEF